MRAILKDTSIYAIGDMLTKGIGFFAILFYTHYLSQSEIGTYGYILVLVGFVNTFLILGADNAYARYFFEFKTHHERQVLTTTLFLWFGVWFVTAIILPVLYSEQISKLLLKTDSYSFAFMMAFLSLPLRLFSSMSNQALRNEFKTKQFVLYNFFTAIITVGSAFLLLNYSSYGVSSIFIGMIMGDIIMLPFRFYAIKELLIAEVDFSIIKKILVYGVPFVPASVAYWIFSSADRIMLEHMSGLESVGIYTVAVSLSVIMSLVAGAIGQAWSPHAIKAYEENPEDAKILYIKFLNVLIAIGLFIILCASLVGKELIELFFSPNYNHVFYPLLFLLIGIGFQITTQVTAVGISIAKKTIYVLYITFFVAVVNIGLNYFLIPYFQETGASIATAFAYMLLTFVYAFISQNIFKLQYNKKTIIISLSGLIVIISMSFLPEWIRLLLFIGIMYMVYQYRQKVLEAIK